MVAAAKIASQLGLSSKLLIQEHEHILQTVGLPISIPKDIDAARIIEFLKYDKKYVDKPMTFVLLAQVGQLYMEQGKVPFTVKDDLVISVIKELSTGISTRT